MVGVGTVRRSGGLAADQAGRLVQVLGPLWRASRRWTAALVLALFPVLFMVDEAVETPLSPVLPGLAVLGLLVVFLPFILVEASARRYRRHGLPMQARRAARSLRASRAALVAAAVWVALWFAVGT